MTPHRFAALLATYGPALEDWPADEARAARRLLIASATARHTYIDALDDDAALGAATLADPVAGPLCTQLAWQVGRTPQLGRPAPTAAAPFGVSALAACALVGLVAGWYSAAPNLPAPPPVYASVDLTPFTGSGQ